MLIKSVQNRIFKEIFNVIKNKKLRDDSGLFFVEGKKQIDEIPSNWIIKQFFISKNYEKNVKIYKNVVTLSEHLFNKLSAMHSPQGIMAVVEKKHYDIKRIIKGTGPFIILDNIQNPGNLGTIIRSADAFGIKAIFVSKGSTDVYSCKTLRATMGSIFHLPIFEDIDINDLLNLMKKEDIMIFSTSVKKGKCLNTIKFTNKIVFIIGNESHGVQCDVEDLANMFVKIRMPTNNTESLNVAVAASIIMYEVSKQIV
jgi:TrmH family RNA methyltransferase